jgi:hypothetical protein
MIRFRFHLRGLFVVVMIFAIALTVGTLIVKEQQRRRAVIDRITGHGRIVFTLDGGPVEKSHYLKKKYYVRLEDVSGIVIGNGPIESLGLEEFSNLYSLNIVTRSIPNGYLQRLTCKHSLRTLEVIGCPLSRENMGSIHQFKNLRYLYLPYTSVDDDFIEMLVELKQLKSLSVPEAKITDNCVKHLIKMQTLKDLSISQHALSFEALAELSRKRPDINLNLCKDVIDDAAE